MLGGGRPLPGAAALAVALALAIHAGTAAAQGSPGPPLPVGMDLRKARIGAFGDYTVAVSGMPPLKQRFALVARDASTSTLELTTEGGMIGPGATMVLRVVLDADLSRSDRLKSLVMKLGDNQPMELRLDGGSKEQFARLDPRKLVGSARIKVPAGTFATRHYRDKTASGTTDIWVSDEAPPFGIVKLTGTMAQAPGAASHPVSIELVGRGSDARPVIVGPAQPFDPNVLMGQMNRTVGAGGAAPRKK